METPALLWHGTPSVDRGGNTHSLCLRSLCVSVTGVCVLLLQVGISPITIDDLGTVLEVLESDVNGLPTKVKVVNYTVLERSFRDTDDWRICKI